MTATDRGFAAEVMNFYGLSPQPVAPGAIRISNLPPRNRYFTGRAETLEEIDRRLQDADEAARTVGVVPLQGMSGVGKTQLALEYAHRHLSDYALMWWVNAENVAVATTELVTLARQLGLPANAEPAVVLLQLWAALAGRDDWLLIYDNVDDAAVLALLRPPSSGRLLVTGRSAALGRLARLLEIAEFSRAESLELLHLRCPSLSTQDADLIAEALGDLPLAVEQAGCFLAETGIDVADYLGILADQPTAAGLSDPTLDRHPGFGAVFSASRARLRRSP